VKLLLHSGNNFAGGLVFWEATAFSQQNQGCFGYLVLHVALTLLKNT